MQCSGKDNITKIFGRKKCKKYDSIEESEKAPGMHIKNNLLLKNQPPGPVIPKIFDLQIYSET